MPVLYINNPIFDAVPNKPYEVGRGEWQPIL